MCDEPRPAGTECPKCAHGSVDRALAYGLAARVEPCARGSRSYDPPACFGCSRRQPIEKVSRSPGVFSQGRAGCREARGQHHRRELGGHANSVVRGRRDLEACRERWAHSDRTLHGDSLETWAGTQDPRWDGCSQGRRWSLELGRRSIEAPEPATVASISVVAAVTISISSSCACLTKRWPH